MNTSFIQSIRLPGASAILLSFLLGGMVWYPSPVNAGHLSCGVTPFSQVVSAGQAVAYQLQVSGSGEVTLGSLPRGAAGQLAGMGSAAGPGEFSLVISTQRSAQGGIFSLVVLESGGGVICQYVLQIIPSPAVPEAETEEEPQEPQTEPSAPSSPEPPVLKPQVSFSFGSQGSKVIEIQALLASDPALYPEGLVTGWYGPLTSSAVKRLQARAGLAQTGEVDEETEKALEGLREQGASVFRFQSYLIRGTSGAGVVILQNLLKSLGFFPEEVPATGYFGPITEASVQLYQESRGVETTGTVGPITRAALNQE